MTGSALLGNGADGIAYVKSASGVFSYSSYSSGTTFGNSLQSLARRYLSFDGSSGFSGYTSSAGSHDHGRGTIGNSMTGTVEGGPNNQKYATGVFRYSRTTESEIEGNRIYFCTIASFNGSSGFSGYTSSAGSHDHGRGTIGNSMTGKMTVGVAYNQGSYSGVFRPAQSSTYHLFGGGVYYLTDVSFNGSSGFSGSLLSKVAYAIINLYSFWQSYCSE